MAQSTTNLGKIHVFPSETLYNQFKDIIADNDLALLKDDGAYIVAALLEQNGYVKFSNGLILQWGFLSGGGSDAYTWTYPQSFTSSVYSIQLAMRSGGSVTASYNAFKTTSYSLTQWQGYMSLKENVSFFLLAIGV